MRVPKILTLHLPEILAPSPGVGNSKTPQHSDVTDAVAGARGEDVGHAQAL
jgi:hypothetical protein